MYGLALLAAPSAPAASVLPEPGCSSGCALVKPRQCQFPCKSLAGHAKLEQCQPQVYMSCCAACKACARVCFTIPHAPCAIQWTATSHPHHCIHVGTQGFSASWNNLVARSTPYASSHNLSLHRSYICLAGAYTFSAFQQRSTHQHTVALQSLYYYIYLILPLPFHARVNCQASGGCHTCLACCGLSSLHWQC